VNRTTCSIDIYIICSNFKERNSIKIDQDSNNHQVFASVLDSFKDTVSGMYLNPFHTIDFDEIFRECFPDLGDEKYSIFRLKNHTPSPKQPPKQFFIFSKFYRLIFGAIINRYLKKMQIKCVSRVDCSELSLLSTGVTD